MDTTKKIKAVPYIETVGSAKFKKFITQPFVLNMLDRVQDDDQEAIFDGWSGEKVDNGYEFKTEGIRVAIYRTHYEIQNTGRHHPETINDFLHDLSKHKLSTYWAKSVLDNFAPKDYLPINRIEKYYKNLLERLGKGHELLTDEENDTL